MSRFLLANKAFGIALGLSVLWHLVAISAVSIVALPGMYRMREPAAISFLGPILEKTALSIMMANKPIAVRTDYGGAAKIMPDICSRAENADFERFAHPEMSKKSDDEMGQMFDIPFHELKEVPALKERVKKPEYTFMSKEADISGPIASREVFYKPKKPLMPKFINRAAFHMELRFSVSAQGDVKEVIPVVSSGNADIDLMGIRYIKGWKFVPLTKGGQSDEWGVAKIILSKE